VTEDGKIIPFWCNKTRGTLGDLRRQRLRDIVYSAAYARFTNLVKGCSLCRNSSTVESSIFYSARYFLSNFYKNGIIIYLRFVSDYAF
jgi:hypothetical protein